MSIFYSEPRYEDKKVKKNRLNGVFTFLGITCSKESHIYYRSNDSDEKKDIYRCTKCGKTSSCDKIKRGRQSGFTNYD